MTKIAVILNWSTDAAQFRCVCGAHRLLATHTDVLRLAAYFRWTHNIILFFGNLLDVSTSQVFSSGGPIIASMHTRNTSLRSQT